MTSTIPKNRVCKSGNVLEKHATYQRVETRVISTGLLNTCHHSSSVAALPSGCDIVYHYPIYGYSPLIGRSHLLYTCTHRFLAIFTASRWYCRTGRLIAGLKKGVWVYLQ